MKNIFTCQRGALFGLDARIAIGIFSILSVVAGTAGVMSVGSIRAHGFSKELEETARAIEGMQYDLKVGVHYATYTGGDEDAYRALYDKGSLKMDAKLQARWLGPYVQNRSTVHPVYGKIRLLRREDQNHRNTCGIGMVCSLWLTFDQTPPNVTRELNKIFDPREETDAANSGRLQWDVNPDNTNTLWFRAGSVVSGRPIGF